MFLKKLFFSWFFQKKKKVIELDGLSTRENGLEGNLEILIIELFFLQNICFESEK